MAKKQSDCPLYLHGLHGNGQWAKRVRGKLRYFDRDKDAALSRGAEDSVVHLGFFDFRPENLFDSFSP